MGSWLLMCSLLEGRCPELDGCSFRDLRHAKRCIEVCDELCAVYGILLTVRANSWYANPQRSCKASRTHHHSCISAIAFTEAVGLRSLSSTCIKQALHSTHVCIKVHYVSVPADVLTSPHSEKRVNDANEFSAAQVPALQEQLIHARSLRFHTSSAFRGLLGYPHTASLEDRHLGFAGGSFLFIFFICGSNEVGFAERHYCSIRMQELKTGSGPSALRSSGSTVVISALGRTSAAFWARNSATKLER